MQQKHQHPNKKNLNFHIEISTTQIRSLQNKTMVDAEKKRLPS